ncbi:chorion peroxidase isoform X2 [Patella vulgata]|uniref:chorion peroxidase isoform X2 n=1 Tax=Patella vulgata TaxID=6465 RepID=UPI00218091B6|nr:chorion peroxidase isoform X2 [Patella vulgata]
MKQLIVLLLVVVCHLLTTETRHGKDKLRTLRQSLTSSVLTDGLAPTSDTDGSSTSTRLEPRLTTECKNVNKEYRTANGSCNNLLHPSWGQADAPYVRMAAECYDDDDSIPRQLSASFTPLPSARAVCEAIHGSLSNLSPRHSLMVMQWAQFLDHDTTSTPAEKVVKSECCDGMTSSYAYTEGNCFPIFISNEDSFFKTNCLSFGRSRSFGKDLPRQQFNSITAFVDGSVVYGSSDDEMMALRTGVDGLLETSPGDLLPEDTDASCRKPEGSDSYCFLAGDARVNVFPGLAVLHTLFVRFHNKIAMELKQLSQLSQIFKVARLTDEDIFQTSRKIVSAVIQHITYDEFLPVLLGPELMKKYKLNAPYHYDSSINPTIMNEFAAAAFRFGHSMIPDNLKIAGTDVPIHELFFRTDSVIHNFADIVNNLVSEPSEKSDRFVTEEMADRLFQTPNGSLDIVSLNIQRGRDHGLPPFNEYREECGLPRLSFSDPEFGSCGDLLSKVYETADDVDIFVGGLCESPARGGVVGPTFGCIIGQQFHNLKYGDRFFYESTHSASGFTQDQLNMIKKIRLSKILCDHGGINSVTENAFLKESDSNPRKPCSTISNYIRSLFDM